MEGKKTAALITVILKKKTKHLTQHKILFFGGGREKLSGIHECSFFTS
jgi:hypothetical protein